MKSFAPGDVVAGRYELRRPLGHGGICNVFEALHKHTGRLVALKCLNEDYASRADARERLRREALALGAVRHPHVVDVLDADEDRSQPFLVTEVLHGKSLEALLVARQKLPPEDVVTVGAQLASALSAVHAAGMVHRDLKPSNVFIVSLPTGDQHAKLLDFGIARLPETRPDTPRLTASDAVIGTFEYMAPEQLLGRPTDERTDRLRPRDDPRVRRGRRARAGQPRDVIRHLSTGQRVTLRERAPMAPSALCAVVDRCTERSPARRCHRRRGAHGPAAHGARPPTAAPRRGAARRRPRRSAR
ncbi:MAG: serine/threonine-protein kinase [Polyangiales bacterium]